VKKAVCEEGRYDVMWYNKSSEEMQESMCRLISHSSSPY
jgi:hypothetical protein